MIMPILSVKDVAASLAFYTEKLGFEQTMAMDGPDGKTAFAIINLGDSTIGLSLADTANVGQGVVFMVYVAETADIDAVYKDVQAKGVAIVEALKTEYWGDRVFSVKDPDGFHISLCKTVEQTDMEHVAKVMKGEVERE